MSCFLSVAQISHTKYIGLIHASFAASILLDWHVVPPA